MFSNLTGYRLASSETRRAEPYSLPARVLTSFALPLIAVATGRLPRKTFLVAGELVLAVIAAQCYSKIGIVAIFNGPLAYIRGNLTRITGVFDSRALVRRP